MVLTCVTSLEVGRRQHKTPENSLGRQFVTAWQPAREQALEQPGLWQKAQVLPFLMCNHTLQMAVQNMPAVRTDTSSHAKLDAATHA